MGNKLGPVSKWLKRSNEEEYERLLPLTDSEEEGAFENMDVVEEPSQEAPKDVSIGNMEVVKEPLQEVSINNMEVVEEPVQVPPDDVLIDSMEALEECLQERPEDIPLENFPLESLEALEQSLQERPEDIPLENIPLEALEALERFLQEFPEEAPFDNLEPQEQFPQGVLENLPIENFEPPEQYVSFENMEGVEQFLQESEENFLFEFIEPPEQPLRGAPNDVPLIFLETPERPVARGPEISYSLRFFQCFPSVYDQEEFSGQGGMLNNQRFRGEVDLLHKKVPIELILNDDTTSYISHISMYNGLAKEGTTWRLLDKTMDVTTIKSTRPHKRSKYFKFERNPTDNKWELVDSYPFKNEYQGKRFNAPILGVTATYLRDNIQYGKYVNLSKPPVIDLPLDAMESVPNVVHLTTYDIQLVKKIERLFFQGRDDSEGTEYYIRKRSERSFTPNFFSINNANAAGN